MTIKMSLEKPVSIHNVARYYYKTIVLLNAKATCSGCVHLRPVPLFGEISTMFCFQFPLHPVKITRKTARQDLLILGRGRRLLIEM